jgi:hypothetical protein
MTTTATNLGAMLAWLDARLDPTNPKRCSVLIVMTSSRSFTASVSGDHDFMARGSTIEEAVGGLVAAVSTVAP